MKELEDKVARRIDAAIFGYRVKTGKSLSWAGLAKEIGYTPQAPTKWKKGAINYKVIEKIAEFLGADPVWLTYGSPNEDRILKEAAVGKSKLTNPHLEGFNSSFNATEVDAELMEQIENRIKGLDNSLIQLDFDHIIPEPSFKSGKVLNKTALVDKNINKISGVKLVPVISYVQAGSFKEAIQDAQENFVASYTENLSKYAFALEVQGESMTPEFKPGDKIIVDPEVEPKPGDYVIAQNGEHEPTFKKYRPRGYDSNGNVIFELTPLNPDYPILNSADQPIHIVGTVIEHIRALRRQLK
ncbi:S24 family peptidase [Acinetobacter sp. ANC 7454]|uniref:S24 family peptidase n=1 Tax=Acinetobacter thermotolerans TaxID=3151487 RepID=UPI00325B33E0